MAFHYSPKIVTDGLVLYLDAANTKSYPRVGTTWSDISRGGNNGTLVNGPTFNSANGGSIVFDGIDDYVSTPIRNLDRPCTFSTWFNFSSLTANNGYNSFFGQNSSVFFPLARFYFLKNGASNRVQFNFIKPDGSQLSTNALATIQTNRWYNYVAVLTTTSISLYENSILQATTSNSDPFITPSGNIILNAGYYSNTLVDRWPGVSPLFSIYNRALSQQEVLQNYNATKSRFGLL